MGTVLLIGVVFVLVVTWLAKKASRPAGLPSAGDVLARGLVLDAAQQSTGTTQYGRRFEARRMTIDVEVPGRAPYVARGTFLVPRGLEAIPGSALDLSVNPRNPNDLTVLGPGGFTGPWLNNGAPRPF